jgi:hypothetical protein
MSYEGSDEFLCSKGHYSVYDCYTQIDPSEHSCEFLTCGAKFTHWHAIDDTNGEEEDNPNTQPAPKIWVDDEDHWYFDKYGNKFCRPIALYRPGEHWRKL